MDAKTAGPWKDDEFYFDEVLPLARQLLHFHTLPLRPGQTQIEARIQLAGDREITLIQDHARARSERTTTETAPVAREVRGVWAVAARRELNDSEGIRTPAGRAQWVSSPSP
jgi:hypothetical protein